jgi:C1A family cysteine protease
VGELDGNQDSTFEVYSDGLISNFEWPLKSFASCIKDQGIRGTCTAFSVIGAMETLISKKQNQSTNFSEQALYFKGKGFLDPNSPDSDGFAANYFLDNFQNNSGFLVPYENQWDYNLSPGRDSESDFSNSCGSSYSEFCSNSASQGKLVCTKPSSGSSQCGYLSQVKSPSAGARISNSISFLDTGNVSQSLKKAVDYLNKGIPVIVETTLTERFYIPDHGFVAEPSSSDHTSGGHSTLAVGYISEQQIQNFLPSRHVSGNGGYFIIKNSWGPFIGDAGYFYVSFKYLLKYVYSLFAIQDVEFHK